MVKMLGPRIATLDTRCAQPAPKHRDPFYDDPAWRGLVREILAARGHRCEDCGATGRVYADHVIERKDGGPDLDPGNVRLRCPTCHGRKTARAREERFRC